MQKVTINQHFNVPTNAMYRREPDAVKTFEESEDGFYITNGQFKGAMILSGYSVNDPDELNWTFNVSELSYREKRNACVRLPI